MWIYFKSTLFPPLLAAGLGAAVIAVGWWVTYKQICQNETRKELRAALDNIIISIHKIQSNSIKFYASEVNPKSIQLGFEIRSSLIRLTAKVERLGKRFNEFEDNGCLIQFLEVITGGDFESSSRKKIAYSDSALMVVSISANELIMALEEKYIITINKPLFRLPRKPFWQRPKIQPIKYPIKLNR